MEASSCDHLTATETSRADVRQSRKVSVSYVLRRRQFFHVRFKGENVWLTLEDQSSEEHRENVGKKKSESSCVSNGKPKRTQNTSFSTLTPLLTLRFNSLSSGHRIQNHLNRCQQPLLCLLRLRRCSCLCRFFPREETDEKKMEAKSSINKRPMCIFEGWHEKPF